MNRVIVLAGGKGSRMNISLPKALVEVAGRIMIDRVIDATRSICAKPIVVIGHQGEEIKHHLGESVEYVWQKKQLGTGHAIESAKDLKDWEFCDNIVVVPGDHPLVSKKTIKNLIEKRNYTDSSIVLATVSVPNFEGEYSSFYNCGRIIRNQNGGVDSIVELKDANEKERRIKEVNVSFYCFKSDWLWLNISELGNMNASKEYYITDLIELAREGNDLVTAIKLDDFKEGLGVNTLEQKEFIDSLL